MAIPFELHPTESYKQSRQALEQGECNIIVGEVATERVREKFFATQPYFISPRAFATHVDTPFVSDFTEIAHLPTGVLLNSPAYELLPKIYPNVDVIPFESTDEGLLKVASGEIHSFVNVVGAISYSLQKQHLTNVKIGGALPSNVPLSMLVNKQYGTLVDILNEAIPQITTQTGSEYLKNGLLLNSKKALIGNYFGLRSVLSSCSLLSL